MEKRLEFLDKEMSGGHGGPLHDGVGSDLAGHLPSIEADLMAISSNAEPDFMALGERLQQGYGIVTALTRDTIEIAELIKGDSSANTLARIEASVNQSIGMLKKCRDNAVSKSTPVKAVQDHLEQLNARRGEIETIARYLRAVALNIYIETSRSETSDDNFTVIAEEIKALSEKILRTSKDIHDFILESKRRFSAMYEEISSGIATMGRLADEAERSAGDSIEKTENLMGVSLDMVENAEVMSRGISQEVEQIVVGVQLHDSMRQRIEHIVSGLKDAEALCAKGKNEVDPGDGNTDNFTTAHAIIVLQCAQLDQIISEIDGAYSQNRTAFGNILEDISLMAQNILQIADSGTGPGRGRQTGEDPFTLLSSDLTTIRSIQGQGADLENRLVVIYEKASETASTLSSLAKDLHNISQESQNKALNAMIAANRLGDGGKTLAVLGKEMRSLSTQADDAIAGVEAIIASIVAAIEGEALEPTFESGSDASETSLDAILDGVWGLYERTGKKAGGMQAVAKTLIVALSEAREGLKFFPLISDGLTAQKNRLNGLAALLKPLIDEKASAQLKDAYMAERYTMEKERVVHKASVAGISGTARSREETGGGELFGDDVPGEDAETDGFDDNIELF